MTIERSIDLTLFTLFTLTLKYSWTHLTPVEYYQVNGSMDLSDLGVFLSICCMVFIVIIGVFEVIFNFDCRHFLSKMPISSKAYCKIDLISLFCNYVTVILYAFFSSYSFITYRAILFGIHGSVAIMHCYYYLITKIQRIL